MVGTNRNARRASVVHLSFNIIGTVILLTVFCIVKASINIPLLDSTASEVTIAVAHTTFNVICTAFMLPMAGLLEKFSMKVIPEPEGNKEEQKIELDERLMATPSIAIERCKVVTEEMASTSMEALKLSLDSLDKYDVDVAELIRSYEDKADHFEDILGSYLVKLSTYSMSDRDSNESAKLLHIIGDFERISDHAVNLLKSVEEIRDKEIVFTEPARKELDVIIGAVKEISNVTMKAFLHEDLDVAVLTISFVCRKATVQSKQVLSGQTYLII